MNKEIDRFHKHLDVCARCRNEPFNLCAMGASLLRMAGEGVMKKVKERP
jgi:hypothetical protein